MQENVGLLDLYKNDNDFKTYVDKYAKAHGMLFPEDCFYHAVVVNYANYLKERKK